MRGNCGDGFSRIVNIDSVRTASLKSIAAKGFQEYFLNFLCELCRACSMNGRGKYVRLGRKKCITLMSLLKS